jgi:hypothetical protein
MSTYQTLINPVVLRSSVPQNPLALRMRGGFPLRYRSGGGGFIGSRCCISQHRETGSAAQVAEGRQPSAGARSFGRGAP